LFPPFLDRRRYLASGHQVQPAISSLDEREWRGAAAVRPER